jgi:membrane-bound lytic murein transglycosylase B
VDKHVFAAVIANDKAEALLAVEEFDNALGSAKHHARAHVARGARAAEAAAARATTKAAAAATAAAKTAAAAAAEAITATAAAAETIAAAAVAAAFKLVESPLALIETTTTPGTTSASIKAHFLSKSSISQYKLVPIGGGAVNLIAS